MPEAEQSSVGGVAPESHAQGIWASEISSRFVLPCLDQFEERWGREALDRFVARWNVTVDALRDETAWTTLRFAEEFFDAIAQETGSYEIVEEAARAFVTRRYLGLIYPVVRMFGSPGLLYPQLGKMGERFNRVSDVRCQKLGPGHILLSYGCNPGFTETSRVSCRVRRAQLPMVPTLWDLPQAELLERECRHDGHPACVYDIHWTEPRRARRVTLGGGLGLGLGFLAAYAGTAFGHPALWVGSLATVGALSGLCFDLAKNLSEARRFNETQNRSLEKLLAASDQRFEELCRRR